MAFKKVALKLVNQFRGSVESSTPLRSLVRTYYLYERDRERERERESRQLLRSYVRYPPPNSLAPSATAARDSKFVIRSNYNLNTVCLSVCLFVCHPGRRGRSDAVGVVRPRHRRRPPACWRLEDRCSYVRTTPNAAALASRCTSTYTALAHRALETAKQSRKDNIIGSKRV